MTLKCIEAGEPYAKGVGEATLFSIDLFRRLLVEGYEWRLTGIKRPDGQNAIRLYHRQMFPSESVATLVSQWFQDFAMRQLRELDCVEALGMFFKALAADAALIS